MVLRQSSCPLIPNNSLLQAYNVLILNSRNQGIEVDSVPSACHGGHDAEGRVRNGGRLRIKQEGSLLEDGTSSIHVFLTDVQTAYTKH